MKLVLVRHGQSEFNKINKFTGWSDVSLTKEGIMQAQKAGEILKDLEIEFTRIHTSVLKRTIMTGNIILEATNQLYLPSCKTWRLNERHYGALKNLDKDFARKKYGLEQVQAWRRFFDATPPLLDQENVMQNHDRRYNFLEPRGESLRQAYQRVIPYFEDNIAPKLKGEGNQLVVAHGSSLRLLIKYLENIEDDDLSTIKIKNGQIIVYDFDEKLQILSKQSYLCE